MPLLHLYDRVMLQGCLAQPLDPELHDLLAARVAHIEAEGLLDMTEIAVIGADTTWAEIIAALGFDPLLDLDGRRYPEPGFSPVIDHAARVSPSYHEAIVTVGNSGFAFQLLVSDSAASALVELCRELAA